MNLLKKVHNCKLPGESMSESWAPVDSWFISLFTDGAGFLPSTVFIHVYSISKSSVHSLCTFCCKRCWPWSAQMQSVLPELQGTPAFITKKRIWWNDEMTMWKAECSNDFSIPRKSTNSRKRSCMLYWEYTCAKEQSTCAHTKKTPNTGNAETHLKNKRCQPNRPFKGWRLSLVRPLDGQRCCQSAPAVCEESKLQDS